MNSVFSRQLEHFKSFVALKFQLYNSLFTSLPFHRIEKTGVMLSLFLNHCEEGYKKKQSPKEIIEQFFEKYTSVKNEAEQTDLLFRFIQYAERQVVLFDALEDAAFREIHDMMGVGTMKHLESKVVQQGMEAALAEKLNDFVVMPVLTAHPTQFYPGTVLGIINDLSKALKENNTPLINSYLQQLGKTPLFKKERPTPYDEAVSLVWYLENIFYNAVGKIISNLKSQFHNIDLEKNPIIKMGFWPGGDRDGNPNVTTETTLKVAGALRSSIIKCYYLDVRRLKRRLTFKGIDTILTELEEKLYNNIFIPDNITELSKQEILQYLFQIKEILVYQHNSLFLHLLNDFIYKVQVFGLHFASLDVRQESTVHGTALETIAEKEQVLPSHYSDLSEEEKIAALTAITAKADPAKYEGLVQDTLRSMQAIATIQQLNGREGASRYIISQCNSALNVLEVYGLLLLAGWKKGEISVDIVPLFETIDDLTNAAGIMRTLYTNEAYKNHLQQRGNKQTIMVGFSDGTKDGGYFMANWSIYKAKAELTAISKDYGIDVVFFDGRGGPPARGGGKTHKYYASIGNRISTKELQLTIQGQTVSSNFGTREAAQFNIEQLLHAGISNSLFPETTFHLTPGHLRVLQELADKSYQSYRELKGHPQFLPYLTQVSPLNYYSETNISSRPSKRGKASRLSLNDLRAIPFVGAWSQLKQNVPGFYGVGMALEALEKEGKLGEVATIYQQSLYFRTIIDNCEMAMKKSFFPLTAYLAQDPEFGELWLKIYEEYERTVKYLAKLTKNNELMAPYPVDQLSIQMREKIVLPLTTIQQYVLARLREGKTIENKEVLERLIVRSSFGIINAGRNSV
ncbi:phosphoenolpyruvate carboxylase [Flavisolibacter nicotianae]|uniref:phosphoenolpyruvate carboxylase n=1 Tax=Flavisolibacter nicotianae TaxID=2364882 RepID=UPI000EB1FEB6|nr:phosphoenolpyruvate carboxylase [Flavisolibacter nicotianae]